uniref:Uncharacterized protein n=1 Tax=Panagrellus redivivus TaxID=6233 RepID=A0A7E4ZQ83_PANRE
MGQPRTLCKCSSNTAKVIIFTTNAACILALTLSFRHVAQESVWRVLLLIGVVVNCVAACVLGTLFGSLDCRKTNVEIRASKQPIVFSIKLPIERTITREHLAFFAHEKETVPVAHPTPKHSRPPPNGPQITIPPMFDSNDPYEPQNDNFYRIV